MKEERPDMLMKKRDPSTHWFDSEHGRGCWASHVDCAIYKVERLEDEKTTLDQYARTAEERMRIAEAKYDAEHDDWLELDVKLAASEQRAAALVGWIDELMAWMMDAIDVSEHGHHLDAGQRSDGEKILAGTRAALAAAPSAASTEGA